MKPDLWQTQVIQNPVRNKAVEVAVLGHITMEPTLSTRKLSDVSSVRRTTIRRILQHHKFHPYKISLVHKLQRDDNDRRLEFCEVISERIIDNPNYLFHICFSEECSFSLNGEVNRHNGLYWSDNNPRIFREVHTQHPENLNVWQEFLKIVLLAHFFYLVI